MKRIFVKLIFLFLFSFSLSKTCLAGNLSGIKDVISTSRPSAASPLSADALTGAGLLSIFDNKSVFLASDSAKIIKNTGVIQEAGLNVASQSAARTSVYLTNALTGNRNNGVDILVVPIFAKHTISFTPSTTIPSDGDIEIILPIGDSTNQASPSASGFSFNGLAADNIALSTSISGRTCLADNWTITASTGKIKCNNVSGIINTNEVITVTLGSNSVTLINPTKLPASSPGTADTWKIIAKTYDNTGIELDSGATKIATIESVLVLATIEPTLTFTIAGINNNTQINLNNSGCAGAFTQTTNTGINSSSVSVDLGVLSNSSISYSAQDLTISTNLSSGYTLTATSSGQLLNPQTGYKIANAQGVVTTNETPTPLAITAGTEAFGIHACGQDVATATWGTRATSASTFYANPAPLYHYTLASKSTAVSTSKTTVVYGVTISGTSPAGLYLTVLTYVATPIF